MSQTGENKLYFNKKISPSDSQNVDGPRDYETIKESSRLIFFVSKFFGYSLFKLPKINLKNHKFCRNFKVKTTLIDFAILVTVILVYISLIYYNAIRQFDVSLSDSLILSAGGQFCLIIGLVVSIAAIILSYVRRETVFKIFINLCYIDILLETFHDTLVVMPFAKRTVKNIKNTATKIPRILDHKNHFIASVLFLVIGLITIGFDVVATYFLIYDEFISNPLLFLSYGLQNTSFLIITTQTVLFLLVIKTRYTALNKLICCYLTINEGKHHPEVEELLDLETFSENELSFKTVNTTLLRHKFRFDRKIIAEFAQTHDKLNDIVEWINCCYAVPCLGMVAVSFGYVIITFFSLYFALYHPQSKTSKLAAVYMLWFVFYMFCMISLIISSWAATREGDKTGVLLHKSINQIMMDPYLHDSQINVIIDSLRTFSQQLSKRSPIVSCGLFTYDWTLLLAIISSSATYLIILIQFNSTMVPTACVTNKTDNATFE